MAKGSEGMIRTYTATFITDDRGVEWEVTIPPLDRMCYWAVQLELAQEEGTRQGQQARKRIMEEFSQEVGLGKAQFQVDSFWEAIRSVFFRSALEKNPRARTETRPPASG